MKRDKLKHQQPVQFVRQQQPASTAAGCELTDTLKSTIGSDRTACRTVLCALSRSHPPFILCFSHRPLTPALPVLSPRHVVLSFAVWHVAQDHTADRSQAQRCPHRLPSYHLPHPPLTRRPTHRSNRQPSTLRTRRTPRSHCQSEEDGIRAVRCIECERMYGHSTARTDTYILLLRRRSKRQITDRLHTNRAYATSLYVMVAD